MTTGWIFDINLCKNSIQNKNKKIISITLFNIKNRGEYDALLFSNVLRSRPAKYMDVSTFATVIAQYMFPKQYIRWHCM